jgi:hypothetical protein
LGGNGGHLEVLRVVSTKSLVACIAVYKSMDLSLMPIKNM